MVEYLSTMLFYRSNLNRRVEEWNCYCSDAKPHGREIHGASDSKRVVERVKLPWFRSSALGLPSWWFYRQSNDKYPALIDRGYFPCASCAGGRWNLKKDCVTKVWERQTKLKVWVGGLQHRGKDVHICYRIIAVRHVILFEAFTSLSMDWFNHWRISRTQS